MNIHDTFAMLQTGATRVVRRRCWFPNAYVFVRADADGVKRCYLTRVGAAGSWAFVPHSTDVDADDWEALADE